jgi:uncharacterized membrane protein YqjE
MFMLDELRNSGLSRTLGDFVTDLADLVQKEIRLARAEVSEKIGARLHAVVWMGAASVLALVTMLFVLEGIVFALIAWGLSPYLSCLLVAAVLAALTLILFFYGRSLLAEDLLPSRTARQLNQDVKTAKEQLT